VTDGSPRYALRFVSGKYQGGEFPLADGQDMLIGRSSELDMVLVEEMVTRRHAKVSVRGSDLEIEDLGSMNGTFVNGEKVSRQKLKEGDRILIGTSIMRVIALDSSAGPRRFQFPRGDTKPRGNEEGTQIRDSERLSPLNRRVFVSYRREDEPYATGRLVDALVGKFGSEGVFHDVDSIPLGVDFRGYLTRAVRLCAVCIVVIGREWLTAKDADGERRLDKGSDFVRIEIEAALELDRPIVPILVKRATMPRAEELPESIRNLAYRNGLDVRPDPDFQADVAKLLRGLERMLGPKHPDSE
jgi:hypothetical protein